MGMRITTNVASINAQRAMANSQREIGKSYAQLASGSRITKSADDAAGLSISETLKSQIRGYGQARRNAMDAQSLVQVSEGGLGEISNILTRLRELGVQAASDTVGERERGFINTEVQQLKDEMQRIALATRFGDTKLLDGTGGKFDFQIDVNNDDFVDRISFDSAVQNAQISELGVDGIDYSTKEGAQTALTLVDDAQKKTNGFRANLGAIQNRLISTQDNLAVFEENLSAANSRLRDADIASSSAELARNSVLLQASTSTLAQANQNPMLALKLLN
ncbi:MAG: flagellin [Bdellovibrionia bacterium]